MKKANQTLVALFAITSLIISGCDSAGSDNKKPNETIIEKSAVDTLYQDLKAIRLERSKAPIYSELEINDKSIAALEQLKTSSLSCALPSAITDLRGGVTFKLYKFDQSQSASASAMGFSGSIGRKEMVLIQDFVRYDFVMCEGVETKIGIGLRCYIHVTSFKGKLDAASPAGIAASVELDRAKCTYELKSLGFPIQGKTLADGLQPQGDYNVENFGKLAVTFNNVLSILNDDNLMIIKPVKLP